MYTQNALTTALRGAIFFSNLHWFLDWLFMVGNKFPFLTECLSITVQKIWQLLQGILSSSRSFGFHILFWSTLTSSPLDSKVMSFRTKLSVVSVANRKSGDSQLATKLRHLVWNNAIFHIGCLNFLNIMIWPFSWPLSVVPTSFKMGWI